MNLSNFKLSRLSTIDDKQKKMIYAALILFGFVSVGVSLYSILMFVPWIGLPFFALLSLGLGALYLTKKYNPAKNAFSRYLTSLFGFWSIGFVVNVVLALLLITSMLMIIVPPFFIFGIPLFFGVLAAFFVAPIAYFFFAWYAQKHLRQIDSASNTPILDFMLMAAVSKSVFFSSYALLSLIFMQFFSRYSLPSLLLSGVSIAGCAFLAIGAGILYQVIKNHFTPKAFVHPNYIRRVTSDTLFHKEVKADNGQALHVDFAHKNWLPGSATFDQVARQSGADVKDEALKDQLLQELKDAQATPGKKTTDSQKTNPPANINDKGHVLGTGKGKNPRDLQAEEKGAQPRKKVKVA